jgi:hypothetical protein
MLLTGSHETSMKMKTTAFITSLLVSIMLITSLAIPDDAKAFEAKATGKLDDLYSSNFSSIPFPSFMTFDPFEEYRHIVFDRTVTIMGDVLLNNTDNSTGKSEGSPTSHHRLQSHMEREEQRREQFDLKKQGSFFGAPYIAPKITNQEPSNQDNIVSKPQWFPSVPAYFCDGQYSFVIEGTANLELDKLKKADLYKVTIKIFADKIGLTSPDDQNGVTGVLDISDDEHLNNKIVERGAGTSENALTANSSLTTHDLTLPNNNLRIDEIKNTCRVHVYNTR